MTFRLATSLRLSMDIVRSTILLVLLFIEWRLPPSFTWTCCHTCQSQFSTTLSSMFISTRTPLLLIFLWSIRRSRTTFHWSFAMAIITCFPTWFSRSSFSFALSPVAFTPLLYCVVVLKFSGDPIENFSNGSVDVGHFLHCSTFLRRTSRLVLVMWSGLTRTWKSWN